MTTNRSGMNPALVDIGKTYVLKTDAYEIPIFLFVRVVDFKKIKRGHHVVLSVMGSTNEFKMQRSRFARRARVANPYEWSPLTVFTKRDLFSLTQPQRLRYD